MDPIRGISALEVRISRVKAPIAKESFYSFIQQAWPIVEPAMDYVDNWHVEALAIHLEAVAKGEIRKLLINVPPGHAKSLIVSVFWPAWVWTWRPTWRVLCGSYAHALALRDSIRCRQLIESPWYVEHFRTGSKGWDISDVQNRQDLFANTKSGSRQAMSVEGVGTGYRGDAMLADDPISAKDAESQLARAGAIRWWDRTMSNRLNDMRNGTRVIIMQRLHEEDLSGHVLGQGGYEHLCLPSEFEPKRRAKTFAVHGGERKEFWQDRRTEPGELLFPTLFPKEVLTAQKVDLGSYGFAGQHQQSPFPAEGGRFKKHWWNFYVPRGAPKVASSRPDGCTDRPPVEKPENFLKVVLSLDATFKDGKKNDRVAFTVWGVFKTGRYLLYGSADQMGFLETLRIFRELSKAYPHAKKLVEDKANGPAIIDTLKEEISGIVAVNPEGGKESRASAIEPLAEAGNIYLPEGYAFNAALINEFAAFPRGAHDDIVDSTSQAMIDIGVKPLSVMHAMSQL